MMETSFKRAFAKDLRNIPQQKREKIEAFIFETAPQAESTEGLGSNRSALGAHRFLPKDIWRLSSRVPDVGRETDFLSSTAPQRDLQKVPVKLGSIQPVVSTTRLRLVAIHLDV